MRIVDGRMRARELDSERDRCKLMPCLLSADAAPDGLMAEDPRFARILLRPPSLVRFAPRRETNSLTYMPGSSATVVRAQGE